MSTANIKAVPTQGARPGQDLLAGPRGRRAERSRSGSRARFTVAPVTTPIPLAPGNGASLPQPDNPPLLQWSSSQGAISYTVQRRRRRRHDRRQGLHDQDHVPGRARPADHRRLVLAGHRRQGSRPGEPAVDRPPRSTSRRSRPRRIPTRPTTSTRPSRTSSSTGSRCRAPGPTTSRSPSTTRSTTSPTRHQRGATRYSPAITLDNDQFWWRVRAVDLAGQPTPWTTSLFGFQRQWLDQPQPSTRIGNGRTEPSLSLLPVDARPARRPATSCANDREPLS